MGAAGQTVLTTLYALAAAGLAATTAWLGWLSAGQAALAGLILFLTAFTLHEHVQRRRAEAQAVRRILLLKRAHDRLAQELAVSRDEIRRLFELIETEDGDDVLAAIRAAAQEAGRETGPAAGWDAGWDAGSGSGRHDARDAAPAAGSDRPPGGPGAARRASDDPDVESEVRVLHQLVEQLYADDAPAAVKGPPAERPLAPPRQGRGTEPPGEARAEPRTEPRLGRAAPPPRERSRPPLRVVADGGPNALSEERVLEIVRDGLRQDRVDLYLQPIVSLPQRKRRFYECFSRIRAEDGTVVTPDQYLDPARRAGLSTAVDNMLLFRCVQLLRKVRRRDATTAFFCNISPHTLADREFFRDFIAYMENHRELASSLVLEMAQADFDRQRERLAPDLKRIAAMGYRFSLDAVDRLDLDLDELEALNIHFLKIDAGLILETLDSGGDAASSLRMLKQQLDARDVDLIVERIETERMLVELLEFNIDFGQGYLFGEPRLSRDQGDGAERRGAE
ncbi:MAG: EAL domain-containing protein [Marivibrio sp.]|uniref:EAL domain-containing protein n=1 Tax=Marivibrio sp. TaxID=2039719 RepID=UPI0032EB92B0